MEYSDDSDNDDVDKVVKEIPICLAKTLLEKLFLFQYPVRPSSLTYDNTPHFAARMKPKQQKVELDLGIDTNSPAYCFSRGEQIADAVDQTDATKGSNQKSFFPGQVMDRQTLCSVRATENMSKYVAAVYSKGTLHLTPVKGIIQLRPGFSYFNKAEENQKKAAAAVLADEDEQSQDEAKDAHVVQLRFAKNQQRTNKQAQAQAIQAKKEAEENWIEMDFYNQNELRATQERHGLYCQHNDFDSPEFQITSRDYLKILSPRSKNDIVSPAQLPHGKLSLVNLQQMELTDQLKNLMITAKIIHFSQLSSLLGLKSNEKDILQVLSRYAVLVQGCWVVKSEILYPKGTQTSLSGMPVEKIWPSRDFLMFQFNRKRFINRKEASLTKLPTEELREVLETLARQKPGFGWEFVLHTDKEFLRKRFDVCNQQYQMWKEKYKSLITDLNLSDPLPDTSLKETDFPGLFGESQQKIHRRRRSSQSESGSESQRKRCPSQSESGTESRRRRRLSSQSDSGSEYQKKIPSSPTEPTQRRRKKQSSQSESVPDNQENNMTNSESNLRTNKNRINSQTDSDSELPIIPSSGALLKKIERKKALNRLHSYSSENGEHSDNLRNELLSSEDDLPTKKNKSCLNDSNAVQRNKKSKKIKSVRIQESQNTVENEIDNSCISDSENPVVMEVEVSDTTTTSVDEIFIPPKITENINKNKNTEKPPSDLFLRQLRKFCHETIRLGSISLAEIKEILSMRQQEPGNILCSGVTDDLLISCLKDKGAVEINLNWEIDSNVPPDKKRIFVVKYTGEPYDKFRSIIIDMFEESFSLRRKDIIDRFKSVLGELPTNHFYTKILTEFCENHCGQWYLNGTFQAIQNYDINKKDMT